MFEFQRMVMIMDDSGRKEEQGTPIDRLVRNISSVFIGKEEVAVDAVLALLSDGHVLLEDVPGVGKTLLAKAIAKSVHGVFKRIQFTADLLPTDITGVTVFHQQTGEFSFRPGPIFANVLLGDEINRATPRTQSSLLEAMEEHQVTVEGTVYKLERPFFVIATQNPIELEGTYPLPFSQMDRFIIRMKIGYLPAAEEKRMLLEQRLEAPIDTLKPVVDCGDLLRMQEQVRKVDVSGELYDYLVKIIRATRESELFEYGASPRASIDLMRFSQAMALFKGRNYLLPDDIKRSAPAILGHRVIMKKGTRLASSGTAEMIEELVGSVPVPV